MSRIRSSTIGVVGRPQIGDLAPAPPSPISARPLGADPSEEDSEVGDNMGGGLSHGGGMMRAGGFGDLTDLGHFIQHRPTKDELVQRNILKDDKVAPRLQAAQEELKKKRLEDMLNHKMEQRAPMDKLVDQHILHSDPSVAPALHAAQEALKRQQIEDGIAKSLRERPPVPELVAKSIIKAEDAPGV
ncbi:hypothetical protein BC828DRAFT_382423 [Blastocladiella britannica]|nr:hypothetical protein BC828DRAFT_382423 [Blastocladiella britannica]